VKNYDMILGGTQLSNSFIILLALSESGSSFSLTATEISKAIATRTNGKLFKVPASLHYHSCHNNHWCRIRGRFSTTTTTTPAASNLTAEDCARAAQRLVDCIRETNERLAAAERRLDKLEGKKQE
jgi:hypothetical protein